MPQTYAEKIEHFNRIIAFCEREIIEERKYNSATTTRIESLEAKIEELTRSIERTDKEKIIRAVNEEKKQYTSSNFAVSVSVAMDLPDGFKDASTDAGSKHAYSTEEMYRILDREMRGNEHVKFSNMIWANDPKGIDYDPAKVFADQLEEAQNLEAGKALIVPILSDHHWTAGMFRKRNDGKLEFLHNDPEGNAIGPDSILGKWFAHRSDIDLVDLQVKQQFDNYNCGPYTISSLLTMAEHRDLAVEDLKSKLAEKISPEQLREKHANILKEDELDRAGVTGMLDALKERAICSKMNNMYEQFREEGRMSEGKISCNSIDDAKELAEQIKKSYEDIGVKPCSLEHKGENWVVRLPEKCRGRDPFKMDREELKTLKEELGSNPSDKFELRGDEHEPVQASAQKSVSSFGF